MKYLIGFKGVQNNLLANLNVAGQLIMAVPFNNPIIPFRIMHVSQDLLVCLVFSRRVVSVGSARLLNV